MFAAELVNAPAEQCSVPREGDVGVEAGDPVAAQPVLRATLQAEGLKQLGG